MNNYLTIDPWKIIENGFDQSNNLKSESIFSLGNGYMGQRANLEEGYSGPSLQGTYVSGIYYNDKTKVGWWKNGYPESFAKVLNAPYWNGITVWVDGDKLDLATCRVESFERRLNMYEGTLERDMIVEMENGKRLLVKTTRLISMHIKELAAISMAITPLDNSVSISIESGIDGNVCNEDANYDENFWEVKNASFNNGFCRLIAKTKKTCFNVAVATTSNFFIDGERVCTGVKHNMGYANETGAYAKFMFDKIAENRELRIDKYIHVEYNNDNDYGDNYIAKESWHKLIIKSDVVMAAFDCGELNFEKLLEVQKEYWAKFWQVSDIEIEGDESAQQAIRFNIFQLHQTYTGHDPRLNIGPKGFTGEKYGGSTYWDTEAFCLPIYLSTGTGKEAYNLLQYRYRQLDKAIENANKLGFSSGAALYPMVTMNGEECHNEWEITFEEIHRNGALAMGIYKYINYTGDKSYLTEGGLDVLLAIARFWAQRFSFSSRKNKYVMLGVTGPNEYENNVNNNWYTNSIAAWCLEYALECIQYVKDFNIEYYHSFADRANLGNDDELDVWRNILDNIYLPYDEELGIFLQQDGFLDKELIPASEIPTDQRPINQHWSWDRILRSCYIKQADVLQGLYFLEDKFDKETIARNYNFYEPLTVHESSLSPSVHSVLASKLDMIDKAYEMFMRASRLDLDDVNKEVGEGLHITSMGGSWMAIVEGFAGMRIKEDILSFDLKLPEQWHSLSFCILFRGNKIKLHIKKSEVRIFNLKGKDLEIHINKIYTAVPQGGDVIVYHLNNEESL